MDERREERSTPIALAPHRPQPETWRDDRLTVAWLGHATVLINFYGTRILTDPALMARVGVRVPGITTLGPRRLVQPALRVDEIPRVDLILLSHAHMDHTDLPTLRRLNADTPIVVQRRNSDLVTRFSHVTELDWRQSAQVGDVRITAIETKHWGARTLNDPWRGYGGYIIEKNNQAIVFGGDTADTRLFTRLPTRLPVKLAVMPIGAYDPYIAVHASPEQAWRMTREMNAEYMLPVHHATFKLSREPVGEPLARLLRAAGNEKWRIAASEIGATWTLP